MKKGTIAAILILAAAPCGIPAEGGGKAGTPSLRPAHTFSIVARDPETGQMGVAVQSHWFSVGSDVAWAEAGVGAVATQSFIEPAYGPRGLALMRQGKSAQEALGSLLEVDRHQDVRQVAMVDARGRTDAHTGERCIPAAGHEVGEQYSVQANLMTDSSVWTAMARAYEASDGDLAERLLAALEAAQAQGGDIRGRQSAAILIVSGEATNEPWKDRLMDLRVEDHRAPVAELRRLVGLWRAFELMNAGDEAVTEDRAEDALRYYSEAERLMPESDEFVFWHAVALVSMDRVEDSLPVFARAFRMNPSWLLLVERLPVAGLLPEDPELLQRILGAAPNAR
jgi:uncharacterized Ntn-hydrolase superfamily protein